MNIFCSELSIIVDFANVNIAVKSKPSAKIFEKCYSNPVDFEYPRTNDHKVYKIFPLKKHVKINFYNL